MSKSENKAEEMKGRVKKAVGELTGNDQLKREGTADKVSAKVKEGVDKVKDAVTGKDR
ncbi:MAG: CsbD family protein [Planctomycetaceae bacterium]